MAFSKCYAFGKTVLRLSMEGHPFSSPSHFAKFETEEKPTYRFEVYHQEPLDHNFVGAPVFTGKDWGFYKNGSERLFHIAINNERLLVEYFVYLNASTDRGEIYCVKRDITLSVEMSPLDSRPLELLLIDIFASRKSILMHATGVIYEKQAYIFTGVSEAGKSTLARLWMKFPGVEVISDERVLICEHDHQLWAFGTPWKSSAGQISPSGAPLTKIYILHHAAANEAIRLKPVQASAGIFARAYPAIWDQERLAANIDLIKQMVTAVPCYSFGFVPDTSAIEYLLCHP